MLQRTPRLLALSPCLSLAPACNGDDGTTVADLPRPVEVVPTHGAALRAALEAS